MRNVVLFVGAALLVVGIAIAPLGIHRGTRDAKAESYPVRARVLQLAADSAAGPATPTPTKTPSPQATTGPTSTPSPTATKSPTSTPTPSQSTGVYSHHSIWYIAQYTGTVHVEGLVTNGLSGPIDFTEVTADFYGSNGQLLATDFGFSAIDTIPAGGTSPYTILLIDPPPGITSVSVRVTDYDVTPYQPPVTGLSVAVTNIYRSITGTVHVVGKVTNNASVTYTYVEPIGAFVDPQGNVIRTDYTFTSPDTLAPGGSGTFDILFLDAPAGMDSANFLIWVDANR